MYLAIFEFLGTSELLIILVVALILFGPRKLPQLTRQMGRSFSEFKRASEDFQRTWEKEVELEKFEEEGRIARAMLQDDYSPPPSDEAEKMRAVEEAARESAPAMAEKVEPTIARTASDLAETQPGPDSSTIAPESSRKRDWL